MQHILASLNDKGKGAIVFDTDAASRGSGNAKTNKEKDVRKWFIENDYLEGVLYLPENLFYNTPAPGIILFLNKNKSAARKNKFFLVNASKEFAKGDPKNYITDEGIERIVLAFLAWTEMDRFSRIVLKEEIVKNDYNISPSRYIHVSEAEEYRPIGEIWEEIKELDVEAKNLDTTLAEIIGKLGL
jgi:type I restriction enzyme M protein